MKKLTLLFLLMLSLIIACGDDDGPTGLSEEDTAGDGQWTAGDPFENVQSSYYWTSTQYLPHADDAWHVNLYHGVVAHDLKTDGRYVWCVRGGQ